MVQPGHHGPLDCIHSLSSVWKGLYIRLFGGRIEQTRVQAFQKRFVIVSDDAYSFIHLTYVLHTFVVDTSGFRTALTRST